jgi:protein-disulfide isomerase/uncharacterized membrane protein
MKKPTPVLARLLMATASLVGLFASAYLFYTYVSGAPIACGAGAGCEIVRASKWAYSFGVPRPLLGLVFYAGVFGLLVARVATVWRPRLLYRLTMFVAAIGFIESAFLFLIQWLDIRAFCIWCLVSAAMATVLVLLAFFDREEAHRHWSAQKELKAYLVSLLAFLPIAFIGMLILVRPATKPSALPTITEPDIASAATTTITGISTILLRQETPTEGPVSSTVLVVEFADFQCPACGAFHPTMKAMRERFAGRVRFAFRQFPLTQIHEHAFEAAMAATCANKQNRFWTYADVLFTNQDKLTKADLEAHAKTVGLNLAQYRLCLADSTTKALVESDLAQGLKLGIRYTPTIIVNRLKIEEMLSESELANIIEDALTTKS